MVAIYKITSPSNKVYIGKSKNFYSRLSSYRNLVRHSIGRKLYNSFMKYGFNTHRIEIIHDLPKDVSHDVLNVYEKAYIKFYKEAGIVLLNLTDGGDGSFGFKHTEEGKRKISNVTKGRFLGSKNPNFGKGCYGNRNGSYGKDRRHIVAFAAKANEKVVHQYSLSGELLNIFDSITKASVETGVKVANISACCLNKKGYDTAGGFKWNRPLC